MNIAIRPRAEDPNVSMRLIEKIKHKCQDYFREIPETITDSFVSELQNDVFRFKKDCLVALELAQQFIEKTVESTPKNINKSEFLKLECEVERLTQANLELKKELESKTETSKQPSEDLLNNLPESNTSDESERLISELQAQLVIQELKFENSISDLESSNLDLKQKNKQLEASLKESEKKVAMLEKKVKDSLSGYSKFLVRKTLENKEAQTSGGAVMSIEIGTGLEVQRSNEFMSQISRLSITESEIFDVTSMQVCDVHHQSDIFIKKEKTSLARHKYEGMNFVSLLSLDCFSIQIKPNIEKTILVEQNLEICFLSPAYFKKKSAETTENFTSPEKSELQVQKNDSLCIFNSQLDPKPLNIAKIESLSIIPVIHSRSKVFSISTSSDSYLGTAKTLKPSLEIHSIFSHKSQLSPNILGQVFTTPVKPSLSLSIFKCLLIPSKLDTTVLEPFSIHPSAPEDSKTRSSKRRGSQMADRKPAIEEYFSLVSVTQTFQAVKMKLGQAVKNLSQDELYQKATNSGIPFFEWNEWVALQLKP